MCPPEDFYPRSPCGERLGVQHRVGEYQDFYPRSPCGERRKHRQFPRQNPEISIHALLAESDARGEHHANSQQEFLSTLSLRRATAFSCFLIGCIDNFYPRSPCGERQASDISTRREANISIHALLAESDHNTRNNCTDYCDFYPRSPCGERHKRCELSGDNRNFYPRSPCGERRHRTYQQGEKLTFLSTLSLRRATRAASITPTASRNFYPRSPCGERRSK